MFTRNELNVLQQALAQYRGPYGNDDFSRLVTEEIEHYNDSMKISEQLRTRFEEILMDYHTMENSTPQHPTRRRAMTLEEQVKATINRIENAFANRSNYPFDQGCYTQIINRGEFERIKLFLALALSRIKAAEVAFVKIIEDLHGRGLQYSEYVAKEALSAIRAMEGK